MRPTLALVAPARHFVKKIAMEDLASHVLAFQLFTFCSCSAFFVSTATPPPREDVARFGRGGGGRVIGVGGAFGNPALNAARRPSPVLLDSIADSAARDVEQRENSRDYVPDSKEENFSLRE